MPIYEFQCLIHGEFERFFEMNKEKIGVCQCGRIGQRVYSAPLVTKDRLWQFTSTHLGEPIEIHSKQQFERICKEKGVQQVTKDDLMYKGEPLRPDRSRNKEKIRKTIRELGPTLKQQLKSPDVQRKLAKETVYA